MTDFGMFYDMNPFAYFRMACLRNEKRFADPARWVLPAERKEFVPLFEGDKLIGQLTIFRPRDARNYLPFVERIHPDDEAKLDAMLPAGGLMVSPPAELRVQRFYLHKGRYVLEGTQT